VDTVLSGLHASEPEQLGFGPALEIRAFLLERAEGNLLLYRSAALKRQAEVIDDLGGISRQYLNHWHEAAPTCDWVAETFGAPLLCHADDEAKVSEACNVSETFAERHIVGDDFEVIPTPATSLGPPYSGGRPVSIAACLPGTRSSSPAASGWPLCSRAATGSATSRASS
jgi:hypothetical protein